MAPASYNRLTKQFIRAPNPYCYRCPLGLQRDSCSLMCLKVLRTTIERGVNGPVAGLIVEPLQASGGQVIFPKEWLQGVREICNEFGIVLIYDEIQTYARIGTFFAGEYYGVDPDVIVLGKGLGAGFPIGAIIIRDSLEGFSPETEELHTFANNSVAQVAGLKLIEELERGVLANCRAMGDRIGKALREMQKDFPVMGDVRQAGLHIGIELVKDPRTREPAPELVQAVRKKGLEKGIIFGLGGTAKNVLKIKPPLIITAEEADTVLDLFRSCLSGALG
jgi:4-aminobutyrate aminotransferase-like enzyme